MTKLKVAIVGCGSITRKRHALEYAANEHVEMIAFCDIVEERAVELAEQYGGRAYRDYNEMLEKEKPDLVSVCTSNADHAEVTIAAAKAGAHILCEKPMATSMEEAKAMIQAAKDNNVYLMIGHNQRMMPPHVKAKEVLLQGKLGKVLTFRTAFGHPGPEGWSIEGKEGWFFQKDRAYVGAMGDLGVHKADLIRWMLDDEVVEVGAFVETLHKEDTDVDDNATCILRMSKGAIGTMAASWTYYKGEDNSTVLYCENGVLKVAADPTYGVIAEYRDGTVDKFETGAVATNTKQTASGIVDAFVNSVLTNSPPSISGEEGMKSLHVIIAAMESAEKKTIVRL